MNRRIPFALLAAALLVVAVAVGRSLLLTEEPPSAITDDEAGAVAAGTAGSPPDPRSPSTARTQPPRPPRLPPSTLPPPPQEPDHDFADAPFPDEETERAMRLADEQLDPGTPWPIDADGINGAIRENLGDIKECYDSWLQLDPSLEGKVVVGFVIAEDDDLGAIREIQVTESTAGDNTFFEGCVLNVMSDLQFEAPTDGEVTVSYPFMFSSE